MATLEGQTAPFIFGILNSGQKSTAITTIALDAGRRSPVPSSQTPSMTVMSRDASIRIDGLAALVGPIFRKPWAGSRKAYPLYDTNTPRRLGDGIPSAAKPEVRLTTRPFAAVCRVSRRSWGSSLQPE